MGIIVCLSEFQRLQISCDIGTVYVMLVHVPDGGRRRHPRHNKGGEAVQTQPVLCFHFFAVSSPPPVACHGAAHRTLLSILSFPNGGRSLSGLRPGFKKKPRLYIAPLGTIPCKQWRLDGPDPKKKIAMSMFRS